MPKSTFPVVMTFVAAIATASHAKAANYSVTILGGLPGSYENTATAINQVGQVRGTSSILSKSGLASDFDVIWSPGLYSDPVIGTGAGFPRTANPTGQVSAPGQVGFSSGNALYWAPGASAPTVLRSLGGSTSSAQAINSLGQIIGASSVAGDTAQKAVVWLADKPDQLPTILSGLGGTASVGAALNDSGQVVGQSQLPGDTGVAAVLWSVGDPMNPKKLDGLGGSLAFADGINNYGYSVGMSFTLGNAEQDAVVWTPDGTVLNLGDFLGTRWNHTVATGINDAGYIVGYGAIDGNNAAAFLLTPDNISPVPLPSSLLTFATGLGLLAFMARRPRSG